MVCVIDEGRTTTETVHMQGGVYGMCNRRGQDYYREASKELRARVVTKARARVMAARARARIMKVYSCSVASSWAQSPE